MTFSKQVFLAGTISVGLMFSAIPSIAATVYQNSSSFTGSASNSDADSSIRADDFVLTGGNTTIRSIQWRGRIGSTGTKTLADNFTIQIYSDIGGSPDSALHTFNVGNSVEATQTGTINYVSGTAGRFLYSANIAETTLTAGTTYWLSVFNDTTADTDDTWFWEQAAGTLNGATGSRTLTIGSSMWSQNAADFNFSLDDASIAAVPVPAAVWLMGSALAGLLGFSRKAKAKT